MLARHYPPRPCSEVAAAAAVTAACLPSFFQGPQRTGPGSSTPPSPFEGSKNWARKMSTIINSKVRLSLSSLPSSLSACQLPSLPLLFLGVAPASLSLLRAIQKVMSIFCSLYFFVFFFPLNDYEPGHQHDGIYFYYNVNTNISPPCMTGKLPASGHWRFRGRMTPSRSKQAASLAAGHPVVTSGTDACRYPAMRGGLILVLTLQ